VPYQESPSIATIDDTLGRLVGIRICVAVLTDRLQTRLSAEDWHEFQDILDLANGIQDDYLTLRALVSHAYQQGVKTR
jgi:hypothetical protein